MPTGARWRQESVETARRRICRMAKAMGYLVTRTKDEGVVTLQMMWLGPNPHVRLVQIVPDGTPDDPWLHERIVSSGLAIPHRVTPRDVQGLLDTLADIERTLR